MNMIEKSKNINEIAITLDLDWAPDFVIADVAELLKKSCVRATWFVTHASSAVDDLRKRPDLFELGIHPNFLPGSTQGTDVDSVLDHCMSLVPDAVSYRSHSIFQCGRLYAAVLAKTPIRIDSNTFLPAWPKIKPIKHVLTEGILTRVPFFWIDDYEMCKENPSWTYGRFQNQPGLQVFAFHPLHIYLNSKDLTTYDELKKSVDSITSADEQCLAPFRKNDAGVRTIFNEVVASAVTAGGGALMRDFI